MPNRSSLPDRDDREFKQGIDEFNAGDFFACHETLESVWRRRAAKDRELIQGIIQVAVALYHLERGNLVGAKKLLARAQPRLEKFLPAQLPTDLNVNVQQLHAWVLAVLEKLHAGAGSDYLPPRPTIQTSDS